MEWHGHGINYHSRYYQSRLEQAYSIGILDKVDFNETPESLAELLDGISLANLTSAGYQKCAFCTRSNSTAESDFS